MKKETRVLLEEAADYTSPEIRMYETKMEMAGLLKEQSRFQSSLMILMMGLLTFRSRVRIFISAMLKTYRASSVKRR